MESQFYSALRDPRKEARDYLVLSEVVDLRIPQDMPLDLWHLCTLFVVDSRAEGRFYLSDLQMFAELCRHHQAKYMPHEFRQKTQGYCTVKMRERLKTKEGKDHVVQWLLRLLKANTAVAVSHILGENAKMVNTSTSIVGTNVSEPGSPVSDGEQSREGRALSDSDTSIGTFNGEKFKAAMELIGQSPEKHLDVEAARILHKLLRVQETHGLSFQAFLDMLQQAGEDAGELDLRDEVHDELVPVSAIQILLVEFVDSLASLLEELLPDTAVEPAT